MFKPFINFDGMKWWKSVSDFKTTLKNLSGEFDVFINNFGAFTQTVSIVMMLMADMAMRDNYVTVMCHGSEL